MLHMKYKIITLCGSTRFKEEFLSATRELSMAGNVVLSVPFFSHAEGVVESQATEDLLGSLHKQKIDMSNEIYVINKDGYIGESTRNEIEYARRRGIPVVFMFKVANSDA